MRFGLLAVPMELKMSFINDNVEEDVRSALQIDGYNVEKYIWRGSFGSINKVRLIDAPTTVQAVKEIRWRSENAIDRENEQNFAKRDDNNGFFLKTYDFRSVGGGFSIFTDFEEGEDLHNKMNFAISPARRHPSRYTVKLIDFGLGTPYKPDRYLQTTMEHSIALLQKHVRLSCQSKDHQQMFGPRDSSF
ncbi:hypothetical protein CAEBREN_21564 [Caenorhabditis brenneri]|uniref:Protein kinase domain-containing protein n=1 Tax=Caenorhabditis brenneri TaxID=135651 RepID=G0ND19_CAEBE|nr:hypothetical protein CAEBREN_21564 [Caenorhabditis brenneri]